MFLLIERRISDKCATDVPVLFTTTPAAILAISTTSSIFNELANPAAIKDITVSPAPETSKTSFDSAFNFITFLLGMTKNATNYEDQFSNTIECKCLM